MAEEELIDGQYQFVMSIAAGASSEVLEVAEKSSGRHYAMKILKSDVAKEDFRANKAQMKRESEIHKKLTNPFIVKFEKYSTNRDHTYILMEHFRASNIKIQIKNDLNKVQLQARQLFEGVTSALAYIHKEGFIHRDIKPDNILLNRVGEVRLCDFSLSSREVKGFGKLFASRPKAIQGTRTYIAPETIRKQLPAIQTDLYSLGVVFFEALTGRTVFQAVSPEELLHKHLKLEPPIPSFHNPNIAPEMDRLILKMLKKKIQDRPATADEILSELKRIRIFKEDIVDEAAFREANKENDAMAELQDIRLNSRADAKLKNMLETNAEFAQKWKEEQEKKLEAKKAAAAIEAARKKLVEAAEDAKEKALSKGKKPKKEAAPPPQPQPVQQPMPMPMPMPGYPQAYPGYAPGFPGFPQAQPPMMPMPGMAQFPGQPAMGFPQPMPQAPPGYPQAAQQPQPAARQPAPAPAAAAPKPAAPQPARPPAAPNPAAPASAAPRAPQPAAPAKPAARVPGRPAPPPPATGGDDLETMTDLPDVL